jgi:type II secretory pathway component PulK
MQNSYSTPRVGRAMTINQMLDQQTISKGMKDLFTAVSSGYININTASREVLMLLPGMDPNVAQQIITMRSGPDGVEGNEDDMPFPNIQVIQGVSGMNAAMFQMISRYLAVRSMTFEVDVDAVIGSYHRHFVALLRRNSPRDVQILYFHWR